jgi:spore germination protein YaaH
MKKIFFTTLVSLIVFHSFGQFTSVHHEMLEEHKSIGLTALDYESMEMEQRIVSYQRAAQNCTLNKIVFGWHPYWMNNAAIYNNYQWNLLSDLSYFSYEIDANTGNPVTTNNWATAGVVTTALNNGVRVNLCATLFSNHATFLNNATSRQTCITNLINLVQSRGAHGVNIDIEGLPASQTANFTAFMNALGTQLHSAIPGSQLSIALPAVDWSNAYDVANMTQVDLFVIMGYDYYWSGSTQAGPTDPLYSFTASYDQNLSRSINSYLNRGVPANKLVLGLPFYGREWEVTANTIPANTTGNYQSARTYKYVRDNPSTYNNPGFVQRSQSTYYAYQNNGNWRQCHINNAYTLGKRFDLAKQRNLAGIGIWALGQDDGYPDFWNKIEEKFTNCGTVACNDTIWDMGGPQGNYYTSENYTYTISPSNASSINVNFSSFNLRSNDTLYLYDGPNASSPLIGSYSGTNSPGSFNTNTGHLTVRFKSASSPTTTAAGWQATYQCIIDNIAPTTNISIPTGWITNDFTATYTDTDNPGGTGIDKSFYQVLEYDGTEWRANANRGFFSDNFDQTSSPHPDWTSVTGTWQITNGYLHQSNQSLTNTNIYAFLKQDLSNRYLYHWAGKIDGTGNNRRAGFHFFCDNPTLPNRGNSYFVWFRVDNNKIQIYKVVNDNFGSPVVDIPYTFNANVWYDFKVTFDRILGKMNVYINDVLSAQWTDSSPYASGDYISFRSGDCDYMVNNLKVYRSRFPSTQITVGHQNNKDIRYQNPNPSQPSGRVKSIVQDVAGNLSSIASVDINVDWTPPTVVTTLNDGLGNDIDTTYDVNDLSANWQAAIDTNSGISQYWYAIGDTPGDSNIVVWTNNGINLSALVTSLNLNYGQTYYFTVRALNGAGLVGDTVVSNGQILIDTTSNNPTSIKAVFDKNNIVLYPNPANDLINISTNISNHYTINIYDLNGKIYKQIICSEKEKQINISNFNSGTYFIEITNTDKQKIILPFIKK